MKHTIFKIENHIKVWLFLSLVLLSQKPNAQNIEDVKDFVVSGIVVTTNGDPIIGATVFLVGSNSGTITNLNGQFSVKAKINSFLKISYLGYSTSEIKIGKQKTYRIVLVEDFKALDEVVVVGYGTQKKATLSGAIGTVSAQVFADKPAPNAMAGLQGKVAGLNIVKTSGKPGGEGWRFNIRGFSSNRDLSPLVVIDGVPYPNADELQMMNSNDIESVSVLKDGAASIYGSRAAGGVILITTKTAKQDKMSISYNANVTLQTVGRHINAMNRQQWFEANETAMKNQNATFPYSDLKQYYMGSESNYVIPRDDPRISDAVRGTFSDVADFGIFDTNWFDVMFGNTVSQNHTLSLTGSNKNTNYLVNLGYNDQSSPLKWGEMNDKRYNGRLNLDAKLTSKLTSKTKISYGRESKVEPSTVDDVIGSVLDRQPGMPYQTIDGKPYGWGGQTALNWTLEKGGNLNQKHSRINAVQAFDYSAFKTDKNSLTITAQLGINDWNFRYGKITQPVTYYDYSGTTVVRTSPTKDQTIYGTGWYSRFHQSYQLFGNYQLNFLKNNDLNVMFGSSYEKDRNEYFSGLVKNLSVAELPTLNIGDPATTIASDWVDEWGIASYFGRINYSYAGKYLVEGNFRYDGSSRFTQEKRWGLFGGGSLAWRISEESFIKDMNLFNNLKLRASYGTTGNQEGIGTYDYISRLSTSTYPFGITSSPFQTINPGALVSLDRSWETLKTLNIGLDFNILNDKLSGSVDLFKKVNEGLLIGINYPSVLGGSAPSTNSGTIETNGYELSLTWKDQIGKDFSYNITASFSDNTSMMTYLGGPSVLSKGINSFVQGYAPYTIFGYKTDGIIQNETELAEFKNRFPNGGLASNWGVGSAKIIDKNGDGVLSEGGDVFDLGSSEPRYGYSLNLGMKCKGFDFTAFLQGYGKIMGYNKKTALPFDAWWLNNSSYWVGKTALVGDDPGNPGHKIVLNPEVKYPLTGVQVWDNYCFNDLSVHNYGYVRLKEITLGYSIPQKICDKVEISGLRIYIAGNDIWEWVAFNDGTDPERDWRGEGTSTYPSMRSWSCGINLTF